MAKELEIITSLWLGKNTHQTRIPDIAKLSFKSDWKIKIHSEKNIYILKVQHELHMLKKLRKEMLQQIDGNYIREHKKESELREEVMDKETGRKIIIIKMTNLRW